MEKLQERRKALNSKVRFNYARNKYIDNNNCYLLENESYKTDC